MKTFIFTMVLLSILFISCKDDPTTAQIPTPPPPVVKAVYVLNEGNFGDASGARLSLYDVTHDTVYKDVVESANSGLHLGSLGDDMKLYQGKLYILMSGSENISVVRVSDYQVLQTTFFPGSSPHDLLLDTVRQKIFVTCLFKNIIYSLNLATLAITDSIVVGSNPQGMALAGSKLYVCNSGYGADSTITVIDAVSDTVIKTLRVGYGPTGITTISNSRLAVSCTGNAFGSPPTNGRVYFVNTITNTLEDSVLFAENLWGSIGAGSDGYIYVIGITSGSFYGGPLHKINISTKATTSGFIAGTFYSLSVDEGYNEIYLTDVSEFASDGSVKIYKNDATLKKSFSAQKGPGSIVLSH